MMPSFPDPIADTLPAPRLIGSSGRTCAPSATTKDGSMPEPTDLLVGEASALGLGGSSLTMTVRMRPEAFEPRCTKKPIDPERRSIAGCDTDPAGRLL